MAEKDYSSQDVIEALAAEDFTEEQIRILVPILAYESRVGGKPFVLSAKDSESPSYGLGQANVTTMESAIWMAINETGGEIPGATEQQLRQWETSIVQEDEEDVRDFTPEQQEYAIDYIKNADLTFHAKLVRHMFHQKELESDMNFEQAIKDLYVFTPMKFDPNNTNFENFNEQSAIEAQQFKSTIDAEVEEYYSMPPTTTTTTTPTTTTTLPPEDNNTATLYDRNGKAVTGIDPDIVDDMLLSGLFFKSPPNTTPPTVDVGMNERSPGITNQFGTPPQDKTEEETGTGLGGRKSVADKFNENFNKDVGPITQKIRDRAAAKEDKSIMQIIEMLTANVNKKRSEQGMEELDRKTVLNNRTNQLEKEETKIQFPGSGVPLDIEDVLDFLTT